MSTVETAEHRSSLDHELFPFRTLRDSAPFALPDGARVGFALTIVLQRFHVAAKPAFAVPGMLDRPYPDLGNAAQREVGLRSGLWRILEAIEDARIRATFVVELDALDVMPDAFEALKNPRHSVVAGGQHAVQLHTDALEPAAERAIIADCRKGLQDALGRDVGGWRSPYCSQSRATLDLLAEAGFTFCGDFQNDDRPYSVKTKTSPLTALPMHHFSSDLHNLFVMKQPVESYFKGFSEGARWLVAQGRKQPEIILPLVVHPWITGAPHRIRSFRQALQEITAMPGLVSLDADSIVQNYAQSAGV